MTLLGAIFWAGVGATTTYVIMAEKIKDLRARQARDSKDAKA